MAIGTLAASQIEMLSQSGTGIITITPPATNTNRAITLPDAAGAIVVSGTTPSLNGITFPATQVASGGANTLDDYEEGTWTASLTTTGTGFSSVGYTLNTGRYIKIGRLVNIYLRFVTSTVTIGPATGSVTISGLPFASSADSPSSAINGFNANWAGNFPNFGVIFDASSIINLYRYPASGGYSVGLPTLVADVATVGNSNYVYINFSYETAS